MFGIILQEPGRLEPIDCEPPEGPSEGEAVVQVERIGICGTDLHAYRGRQPFFTYPRILGHELGVVVEAISGGDHGVGVGDRCSVEPYLNCGHCRACRQGRTNCCASLKVLGVHCDGGMRERIRIPVEKLHRSEKLSTEQLALVETLCIGCHAVDRAGVLSDDVCVIVGVGPIGLAVLQHVQLRGARAIVLDINEGRLTFCRNRFGVAETVDVSSGDPVAVLAELTNGEKASVVFDATGNPGSMDRSFDFAGHGARVVLVGLHLGKVTFADPDFHRRELTILSSRNALPRDFRSVIANMESGVLDVAPWITHRGAIRDLPGDFPHWLEPEAAVLKAMVSF
ncbi:MAG: zinc-binding alcohol dehydrogenase family protein [Opitutaceae bacterium]